MPPARPPPGKRVEGVRARAPALSSAPLLPWPGHSWKAVQVQDDLWVGGTIVTTEPAATQGRHLTVPFVFGCQYSETGLFRTQKADGIMGLSSNALTLVHQMNSNKRIPNKEFALCYMKGGGIMTIGGVDPAIHRESMQYVPLTKSSGWFTVHLVAIKIGDQVLDVKASVWNSGKGAIVDSGTTDTYLPRKAASAFKSKWRHFAGRDYGNTKMTFKDSEFAKIPSITFVFKDDNDSDVEVEMKPEAYMERVASKYVPRVYLTEGSGTVLGANFMQDHNVLFDTDNRRVGFARSDCNYARHVDGDAQSKRNSSNGITFH